MSYLLVGVVLPLLVVAFIGTYKVAGLEMDVKFLKNRVEDLEKRGVK